MGINYELAPDLQEQVNEISKLLFPHVKLDSVVCIRSFGSGSRGTIARCHALGKAMQLALGRKGFYVIEVISKRYDKMPESEKTKTLIHELMHIPKSFGGGFIHHNIVHERNVERMYQYYLRLKNKGNLNNYTNSSNSILIEEDNLTPGQKIEREFFVVLDQPQKKLINRKRKNWWF